MTELHARSFDLLQGARVLVTGAAGFIGSNLVERLVDLHVEVTALDNLITGKRANLATFQDRIRFIEGDVRDLAICRKLCGECDFVLHQAALGSVPRSIDDPLTTHDHNVNGTLTMLVAAREAKVRRFVFAASSSAYGDSEALPKVETMRPRPLSPYAVTKLTGEQYCTTFHSVYGLPTVALRYFNVFGPRQDPDSQYAAVIPRFVREISAGRRPVIFGDGEQSRDFTFVDNVVEANLLACLAPEAAFGRVFNIGAGGRLTLNDLAATLLHHLGSPLLPRHESPRPGDVRHSQASIELARELLQYQPAVDAADGLGRTVRWYRELDRKE